MKSKVKYSDTDVPPQGESWASHVPFALQQARQRSTNMLRLVYAQLNLLFLELYLCCSRYCGLLKLFHLNDLNYQKYCKAEYVRCHV